MSYASALMIIGMVIVTYGVRAAPFIFARFSLPEGLLRVLEKVPPAVLAALIVEPIFLPVHAHNSLVQPELIAAMLCLCLGVMGANMLLTVVLGMGSYWLLVWLLV